MTIKFVTFIIITGASLNIHHSPIAYNQMNQEHILTERRNKLQTASDGRTEAKQNSISNDNPEQTPRLASVSQKVRMPASSQAEPVFKGRIKVIRTRLPSDFFAKPDSHRAHYLVQTPQCNKKQQNIDSPSFSKKDGEGGHIHSGVTTDKKPYFDNSDMELKSHASIEPQQTANFFFFSSSQSTCDVDNSSAKALDGNIQKIESPPTLRKNSKSKAQCKRARQFQECSTSRGSTAVTISRPPPLPLGMFKNLLDYTGDQKTPINHFGCTFSIHKNFNSTPNSPRLSKQTPKISENQHIDQNRKEAIISRKISFDERPRLIRQRFGSKNKKTSDKMVFQDKVLQNLWKEPVVTNKKVPFLPPLNAK